MTDKAQTKTEAAQPAKSGCCQNEAANKPSTGSTTAKSQDKASAGHTSSCCCGSKHDKNAA